MKAGLLKKISLALGLVLWVTGSVCASPADEEVRYFGKGGGHQQCVG